jgi:hypothetical protein
MSTVAGDGSPANEEGEEEEKEEIGLTVSPLGFVVGLT